MKKYLPIILLVILTIILFLIITSHYKTETIKTHKDFEQVYLRGKKEIKENTLYKDYDTLHEDFSSNLNDTSFKNNNYIVISVLNTTCGVGSIAPTAYEVKKDTIYITISYSNSCGICDSNYKYFALKVDKEKELNDVKIDYSIINKVKCESSYLDK